MSKLKLLLACVALMAMATVSACAYGGAAAVDEDTVVITKTSLGGLITSVHVCQVTDTGVTNCSQKDAP